MKLPSNTIVLAFVIASWLLPSSALTPSYAASSIVKSIDQALKKVDQDLCRSFDSLKCKRKAPAAKSRTEKSTKPAKVKAQPALEPVKAKSAEAIPIPRAKPTMPVAAVDSISKSSVSAEVPRPRLKPPVPRAAEAAPHRSATRTAMPQRGIPPGRVSVTVLLPPSPPGIIPSPPPQQAEPGDSCRKALAALGMNFITPVTPVSAGSCNVAEPVQLKAWKSGDENVSFPDGPILNCSFALRFGEWLKVEGAPITRRSTRAALDKFYTGPGYQCRGRNGDASSKVSEHGYGNAIDITFFTLKDGRTFQVKDALDPMSPAYQTLTNFRASGCKYFSTVLGPGTNAAHAEHFHFDLGKHGKSAAYKICE